ncbi:MAG: hypothetical protein GY822_24665, partial [Deltaproteobacteria bacterium]|nr:hypothetical protein [Deltaproteobacteria bacterium]
IKRDTKKQKKAAAETATVKKNVANEDLAEEENDQTQQKPVSAKNKRRWFGLKGRKTSSSESGGQSETEENSADEQTSERAGNPNKRTRSSSRSKTTASTPTQRTDAADTEVDPADEKAPRKGLMGWRRKKTNKPQGETESESPKPPSQQSPAASKSTPSSTQHDEGDQAGEEDDIDWNSMSKAQRRRLRKQMKRQNKAA